MPTTSSARASISPGARRATRLRASWGRYQQFQGIDELQVEDGVEEFSPAQSADHRILGVERDFAAGYTLRVEAYRKDYSDLRTRFESLYDPLSLVPELRWDRVAIAPSSAQAEGVELLLTRGRSSLERLVQLRVVARHRRSDGGDRRSWDQTHTVNRAYLGPGPGRRRSPPVSHGLAHDAVGLDAEGNECWGIAMPRVTPPTAPSMPA